MANPKDRAVQDLAPPLAQHEFGHYIVARILGFKVGEVSLTVTYPNYHLGGSVIELATSLNEIAEVAEYIENRVVVLYSGAMAQSLKNGKVDKKEFHSLIGVAGSPAYNATASQDYAKARELVHILRSIKHGAEENESELSKQLSELSRQVLDRATEIVEAESDLIVGLGKALASRIKKSGQRVSMSEAEIDAIEAVKIRFLR